jgi:hypothetical protein
VRRGEKLTSFWECSFLTRRWMLLDGTSLRSRLRYVVEHAVGTSAMINIAVSLPGLSHSVCVSGPIPVYTGLSLRHGIAEGPEMPKGFVGDDADRVR